MADIPNSIPPEPPPFKKPKTRPPGIRFLFAHPAHFIACGLGSGLSPFAPGTAGTLFAWATFPLLAAVFNDVQFLVFLGFAYFLGIVVCEITGRRLGEPDHGSIVWDEIVPFWTVLLLCPRALLWQTAAFFLFRFFDIVKPPPANFFDEKVKNGFGVMTDDVFAALYTVVALSIGKLSLEHFGFTML